MLKDLKINTKLIIGFLIVVIPLSFIFYRVLLYSQNKNLENRVIERIRYIEKRLRSLKESDTKILASTLQVIVQDKAFKDVYLEKDRDRLYNYGQPLFQALKDKYGITHFYFILPDGRCFVRLHNKEVYDDLITRATFYKARDAENLASGIELGKTAYALRVVSPYYNNGELIGYVELGEEINHFLEILKSESNDEYAIFADKEYLDREKWRSVRQMAGLRDNWGDFEEHVILGETAEGKMEEALASYLIETNIERIEKGEIFLQKLQLENKVFAYGGFLIKDATGKHSGVVLSLADITDQVIFNQED